ncbi:MAG: hypothetical protein A4E41_01609 [Methanoregulaceae archaeon PtaU1.Bin066]|nr:MAG: hypothetical protein A4E41_01609 [Methanoregulaceae archaeon PtaU1.Bin066]
MRSRTKPAAKHIRLICFLTFFSMENLLCGQLPVLRYEVVEYIPLDQNVTITGERSRAEELFHVSPLIEADKGCAQWLLLMAPGLTRMTKRSLQGTGGASGVPVTTRSSGYPSCSQRVMVSPGGGGRKCFAR